MNVYNLIKYRICLDWVTLGHDAVLWGTDGNFISSGNNRINGKKHWTSVISVEPFWPFHMSSCVLKEFCYIPNNVIVLSAMYEGQRAAMDMKQVYLLAMAWCVFVDIRWDLQKPRFLEKKIWWIKKESKTIHNERF